MSTPDGPGRDAAVAGTSVDDASSAFGSLLRQALTLEGPDLGRDRYGRFETRAVLGAGTFGVVLLVWDPALGVERALKVPSRATLVSPDAFRRFGEEARNCVRVDHPNVVRVLELGVTEPAGPGGRAVPFLVMEYCPGGSLSRFMQARRGAPAPVAWGARLAAAVARGVQEVHDAGLLHRDLKPGNVLLAADESRPGQDPPAFVPKVADFGLAKVLDGDDPGDEPTPTGTRVGTLAYMSPESLLGGRGRVGPASDVYGLGSILYFLLAGEHPHAGSSEPEIVARVCGDGPPPSPRALRRDVPRDLDAICRVALARRPEDRYPTASALADDLERFLRREPIRGAAWWRRARAALWRRRLPLAGAAAVALTATGLLWGWDAARSADASAWLRRVESAEPADLPALLRRYRADDPRVAPRLAEMFAGAEPIRRRNAALALAPRRPDAAAHVVDHLLMLGPAEIGPIVGSLGSAMPSLTGRLADAARAPAPHAGPDPFAPSRRRANAAVALCLLGRPELALAPLADLSDPTARSLIVHALGPAGVDPSMVVSRIADPRTPPAPRRQLLLALGEFPARSWSAPEKSRATALALRLYRDDPDPGTHGAAKWLLRTWGQGASLATIDESLKSPGYRPGFRWRVGLSGLTFVVFDHAGHRVEITDTEVPRRLYSRSSAKFDVPIAGRMPGPDEPVQGVSMLDCARFCAWLAREERLASAFDAKVQNDKVPRTDVTVTGNGLRIPTVGEFRRASRAGIAAARYFGDLPEILPHYAWTANAPGGLFGRPVAMLKPNDLGLFDLLGNASELCHLEWDPTYGVKNQAAYCGGSAFLSSASISADEIRAPVSVKHSSPNLPNGFRVARTLAASDAPEPGRRAPSSRSVPSFPR